VPAHSSVKRLLSCVAEWRMADVVDQCQRFYKIDVQSQLRGNGAGDLRNFNGVGQAVAEVVGISAGENLGLRFQPAKSARMNDAVAVALKVVTVGCGGSG